jgi:electron transport complex protein RnfE
MSKLQNFLKGLIKENPVLVLVLGTCPTLAISTSVIAAFGMGIAATAVLILSNMAISAIRKIVPDPVRIPCYIVVIAGFVTVVELVMEAYAFSLYQSLGVYLSLIVVNCIILGRAEMYASKHGVVDSAIDGSASRSPSAPWPPSAKRSAAARSAACPCRGSMKTPSAF